MTNLEKLKQAVAETVADEEMTPAQKQEALMTILHNSTQLYMEMLKVNLKLKGMPTQNANVVQNKSETVM